LGLDEVLDFAEKVEASHTSHRPVTVKDVVALKNYVDVYLIKLSKEFQERRTGKEIRLAFKDRGAE
jgi:hypothetical protein